MKQASSRRLTYKRTKHNIKLQNLKGPNFLIDKKFNVRKIANDALHAMLSIKDNNFAPKELTPPLQVSFWSS